MRQIGINRPGPLRPPPPRPTRWAASTPRYDQTPIGGKTRTRIRQHVRLGRLSTLCFFTTTILSASSIVRISTLRVYSGDFRRLVIFSGSKLNPMTVSVLLGPDCDLASGSFLRWNDESTSPLPTTCVDLPRFSQLGLWLRLASPHPPPTFDPSPLSRASASYFANRRRNQIGCNPNRPWIYPHSWRGQLCKRFRRDI